MDNYCDVRERWPPTTNSTTTRIFQERQLLQAEQLLQVRLNRTQTIPIILTEEKLHPLLHTHVCMWHRGRGDRVKQPGQTLRPPGFSQHPQCRQPSCQQQHLEFLVGVCATRLLNIFHITPHEICLWSVPTCPVILEKLLELPAPLLQKRWAIILLQAILTWWAESSEDVQPRELTAKFPPRLLWHLSPQHAPSDRQSVHANFHSWSYSSPPLPSLQTQPATVQAGLEEPAEITGP